MQQAAARFLYNLQPLHQAKILSVREKTGFGVKPEIILKYSG